MRITHLATALILAALTVASAAVANACVICCQPVSVYFGELPADLDPSEVALEVKPLDAEKISLPSKDVDSETWLHRFSVVRVVRGQFDGDAVSTLFSSGPCQSHMALGDGGTGLLVGFVMPPSPDWTGAPGIALRYPGSKSAPLPIKRERFDFTMIARILQDDTAMMTWVMARVRDPALKKSLYDRATTILRARADAGDASAMMELGFALRMRPDTDFKAMVDSSRGPYIDPAREWIERAAAVGNADAMYQMAWYAVTDPSLPIAERRAKQASWHLKAAEAGHACAMGQMAQNYRFGKGVPENKERSLYWYRKAIAAGAMMSPYGYEIEGPRPTNDPLPQLSCPARPCPPAPSDAMQHDTCTLRPNQPGTSP